jgi:hypothetical protein
MPEGAPYGEPGLTSELGVSEMTGFVILAVLLLIAAAAPRYGVDSRPGASRARHTVGADLRAAFSWAGRAISR